MRETTRREIEEEDLREVHIFGEREPGRGERGGEKPRQRIRFRKRLEEWEGGAVEQEKQDRMRQKEMKRGRMRDRETVRRRGEEDKRKRERECTRGRMRQRQKTDRMSKIHTEGKRWRRSLTQTGQGAEN